MLASVRPANSTRTPSSGGMPWTCAAASRSACPCSVDPAAQQRAVDVEEQQEAQRRRSRPGSSRCAKAAISLAAFSTSSSWTISTGECM